MKKIILILVAIILFLGVAAVIYFSGKEYTLHISENEIKEKISEKLPITKKYFFIFNITLDNARVILEEKSNRIKAGTDVLLNIKLGKKGIPIRGTVDLSGLLRYEKEGGDFYLNDIIIDNLDLQGIPEKYLDKSKKVVTKALSEYYLTHPIYTLKSGDTKQAAAKMILKSAIVENKELVVTLGI